MFVFVKTLCGQDRWKDDSQATFKEVFAAMKMIR